MKRYTKITALAGIVASVLAVCSPVAGADDRCDEVAGKPVKELMAQLDSQPPQLRPACIDQAIRRLGDLHATEAIPLLIRYLAYRREPMESERAGAVLRVGDWYPATIALFQMGKPAVPSLTAVIAESEPETANFEQAVEAIVDIYRDSSVEGVQALMKSARQARTPAARSRFVAAAKVAVKRCWPPAERPACEAAIKPVE